MGEKPRKLEKSVKVFQYATSRISKKMEESNYTDGKEIIQKTVSEMS